MDHSRILDRELDLLRDRVLLLGGEAERAIERAMRALVERDTKTAQDVLRDDDEVDRLEVEIDRLSIDIIALRQPAARDLRFVMSVVKMTPILERIADHACNIARVAIHLNDEPELKTFVDLPRMAEIASSMLHGALGAFTNADAVAARRVISRDQEINQAYTRIFNDLINLMTTDPQSAARAARLLMAAKHIERIGDYVKDICELTVYMTEAAFIKHVH